MKVTKKELKDMVSSLVEEADDLPFVKKQYRYTLYDGNGKFKEYLNDDELTTILYSDKIIKLDVCFVGRSDGKIIKYYFDDDKDQWIIDHRYKHFSEVPILNKKPDVDSTVEESKIKITKTVIKDMIQEVIEEQFGYYSPVLELDERTDGEPFIVYNQYTETVHSKYDNVQQAETAMYDLGEDFAIMGKDEKERFAEQIAEKFGIVEESEEKIDKASEEKTQEALGKNIKEWESKSDDDMKKSWETLFGDLKKITDKLKKTKIYDEMKTSVSLVKDFMTGDYDGISKADIAKIVAAIAYVVSPVDIIPDAIPVAGWIDDIFAIRYVIKLLKKEFDDYAKWKKDNPTEESYVDDLMEYVIVIEEKKTTKGSKKKAQKKKKARKKKFDELKGKLRKLEVTKEEAEEAVAMLKKDPKALTKAQEFLKGKKLDEQSKYAFGDPKIEALRLVEEKAINQRLAKVVLIIGLIGAVCGNIQAASAYTSIDGAAPAITYDGGDGGPDGDPFAPDGDFDMGDLADTGADSGETTNTDADADVNTDTSTGAARNAGEDKGSLSDAIRELNANAPSAEAVEDVVNDLAENMNVVDNYNYDSDAGSDSPADELEINLSKGELSDIADVLDGVEGDAAKTQKVADMIGDALDTDAAPVVSGDTEAIAKMVIAAATKIVSNLS
jgi:uncharacterized membrane protein YkvA (DUF1232 family)